MQVPDIVAVRLSWHRAIVARSEHTIISRDHTADMASIARGSLRHELGHVHKVLIDGRS